MRAICYSPHKMQKMKSKAEASSPVKLSNFSIKRNKYTNQDEVHISKRSKLSDPSPFELDFNIIECKLGEDLPTLSIANIREDVSADTKVNVSGRINFVGEPERVRTTEWWENLT